MKYFVMGRSGTGKTPMAKALAELFGWQHIMGSEWARKSFPKKVEDFTDRQAFVNAITKFSTDTFRREPRTCVDFIESHYDLTKHAVIEGIRSPHDFVHLFDPRTDIAIFLRHEKAALKTTAFEDGLTVIRDYLRYLCESGIAGSNGYPTVMTYRYQEFWSRDLAEVSAPKLENGVADEVIITAGSLEAAISHARSTLSMVNPEATVPTVRKNFVHAEIEPIPALLDEEFLFNYKIDRQGNRLPCTIVSVSSYKGNAPTLKVLLESGAVFDYVPPHVLRQRGEFRTDLPELAFADLIYDNCPADEFCAHRFKALAGEVQAYFKKQDLWMKGQYLFTADWHTENVNAHFIALENGQFGFLPQHKLKFAGGTRDLPKYAKLRSEWKV